MSMWPNRPLRVVAGIGVCAALVPLASLFATDAFSGGSGSQPAAEGTETLQAASTSGDAAAGAQWAAALGENGVGAALPPAQAATTAAAREPDPPPSVSAAATNPVAPQVPDAPVEQVAAAEPVASIERPAPDTGGAPEGLVTPGMASASDEPARDCSPLVADGVWITGAAPAEASIEISKVAFGCADEVGLAFADDPVAISTLAFRNLEGPLLLVDSDLSDPLIEELRRLAPQRVVAAGIDEQFTRRALGEFAVEHVGVGQQPRQNRVWLIDSAEDTQALAAVARQVGVAMVAATEDLRALPRSAREAIFAASEVEVLSDLGTDAAWQLEVIRRGEELPGGGLLLFGPDAEHARRRMVAVYGHPSTRFLGVLGEQEPQATVERLRSIASGYEADGLEILPTFEIIATVASGSAGADGDYSSTTDPDVLRPWIETAAADDVYVVLDLQPGRTDYLSQAKRYEEFLRLPHVGLALDPEWRLKPHQVHLEQIGTVDAAEINRVVDWLAGIVREEALPQKLLIVHQFRYSMITNRELIETPPELAVLIHMDGQGSLTAKYNTWNSLTGLADADRFWWGWKNFYDEDSPVATPEQVLALSPEIVFVSFQ